jgi:hypothetical protein
VETVSGNMHITLQNKDDYRNMASFDSTKKLYTTVETAEHVYTESAAIHWAEQIVCTSLDDNVVTQSVLLVSKSVRNGGAIIILILMGPCFLTIFDTSNIARAKASRMNKSCCFVLQYNTGALVLVL